MLIVLDMLRARDCEDPNQQGPFLTAACQGLPFHHAVETKPAESQNMITISLSIDPYNATPKTRHRRGDSPVNPVWLLEMLSQSLMTILGSNPIDAHVSAITLSDS